MSNFWGAVLNNAPAVSAPAVATGYRPSPYFTPQMVPQATVPAVQQPQPGQYGNPHIASQMAKSASLTATCPDCGSGNYFAPQGMPNAMTQCYECGYNPRFGHTTAGAGMPGGQSSGPTRPSKQLNPAGKSNFNGGSDGNVFAHI